MTLDKSWKKEFVGGMYSGATPEFLQGKEMGYFSGAEAFQEKLLEELSKQQKELENRKDDLGFGEWCGLEDAVETVKNLKA